jgi:peptidyl-prolyl cis-trans isomerase SurA
MGVFAMHAQAEYQELDAIIAIVDEDVVLASELLSRLEDVKQQIERQDMQAPPQDVLINQLMERLILENLQLQQAQRRGVEVDDETLTRAVLSFAERNQMTIEQFQEQLLLDGMSYREFREDIRNEMLIQRLQRNLVNRRITISDHDIEALLASPYYRQLLSDEFRVGHILLAVADGAGEAVIDAAAAAAATIVEDLRAGADFKATAIAKSAGAAALEGGDLGWRRAGELPSLFGDQVMELDVGDTADPIRSASGFHVIQLLEQRGAGVQTEDQALVRHILILPSEIRTMDEAEAALRVIHEQLLAGADFCALSAEHSEDPGSALNCGDLGWSTGDQFVPKFVEELQATATGELSEPFLSEYGWHVLEVQERRREDMGEEALRDMAVQILHRRRFDEELQEWLKEIRDEAFVEVRL